MTFADGKVISARAAGAETVDQTILIHWDAGRQKLAIETRYEPDGSDRYVWVVPLPAPPKVTAATAGMFRTAEIAFAEPVEGPDWDPVVFAVFLLVAATVLGSLEIAVTRTAWRVHTFAYLMFGLGFLLLWISSFTAKAGGGVSVLSRQRAGAYDVATVAADTPDKLAPWLRTRGFKVGEETERVLGEYVRAGWVFSVATLAPDQAQAGRPHPLLFEFSGKEPVYPLRLTGAGATKPLAVEVYFFADQRATCSQLETILCAPTRSSWSSHGYMPLGWPGRIGHAGLRSFAGKAKTITRLSGTLSPADMREDLSFGFTAPLEAGRKLYSEPSARAYSWTAGLWITVIVLAVFWVITTARDSWQRGASGAGRALAWRRLRRAWLVAVALGALTGGSLYVALERVEILPKESLESSTARHKDIAARVDAQDAGSLAKARREAAAFWSGQQNALTGGLVVHEDSPGNYTIEAVDGRLRYHHYDAVGARYRGGAWRVDR